MLSVLLAGIGFQIASLLFLAITFFLFVIRLKLFPHGGWHVVERIAC